MHAQQINRVSNIALVGFSLLALITVIIGFARPPQPDEGALAHIFQLSVMAAAAMMLLYLPTADWTQPLRPLRRLAFPVAALALALATLYYLEHYYYPVY